MVFFKNYPKHYLHIFFNLIYVMKSAQRNLAKTLKSNTPLFFTYMQPYKPV